MAFRILDDGDHALANRAVGEVAIRGTSVMLGYLNPDDGSIAAPLTADGWFRTGDIGYIADGQLHILGRKKEVIIIRGSNYFRMKSRKRWPPIARCARASASRSGCPIPGHRAAGRRDRGAAR